MKAQLNNVNWDTFISDMAGNLPIADVSGSVAVSESQSSE